MQGPTLAIVVDRALEAYPTLVALGEQVEDEWQYVTDLAAVWQGRLRGVASERGGEPAPPGALEAVEAAVEEIGLIEDPHRAIDWLSTYPQVILAALGESG